MASRHHQYHQHVMEGFLRWSFHHHTHQIHWISSGPMTSASTLSVGQKPLKLKQGLDSVSCFNTEPDSRFRFNCFESVLKHGVYSPPASSFIITSSSSSMLASSYMSSSLSNASCSAPWSGMEFIVKSSARLTVPSRSSS